MEEVLDNPSRSQGWAVAPIDALFFVKLRAMRRQDLKQYGGDLVAMFDGLVVEALEG